MKTEQMIIAWLARFESCVRRIDYATAQQMFDADVVGFGSHTTQMSGLEQLQELQWQLVWPHIEQFSFDLERLACQLSGDGEFAAVAVPWSSTGFDHSGAAFPRHGRATLVLSCANPDHHWRARHSHFSLSPGTSAYTRKPATA